MKFFITLKRRHLAVILAALIIAFLILGQLASVKATEKNGETNALRVKYIKSLGFEPDDSGVTSKDIVIPESFSEVYREYNTLQKKAGFNLEQYKGENATVYTYSLSGEERQLHIIVCDGKIIGGDIAETKIDGEMKPLK